MSASQRILVVGGGLSGLSCALDLARAGRDVLVLERAERAGGVVGTTDTFGFRFEMGPNTLPASARAFRTLCGDLGIADRLIPSLPSARNRYIWFRGELVPVPLGPLELLATPLLSGRAKLRLLREPLVRRAPLPDGEPEPSLAEFLEERIGPEPTRLLAAAFVRGIYAGDIDRLGARSAFPRLWKLVEDHGSILRGLWKLRRARRDEAPLPGPQVPAGRLLSFPRGLQELVDALTAELGERIRTAADVAELHRSDDGWQLELADGERLAGEQVVLAVPAPSADRLLSFVVDSSQTLEPLRSVDHASILVAHLGWDDKDWPRKPDGFGYLVPPSDEEELAPRALGTIFASNLFADRARSGTFTVSSFYGTVDLDSRDRDRVIRVASEDLALALGADKPPKPRTAHLIEWRDVLPQYGVGHRERIAELRRELARTLPGVHLAGNYVGGVSVEHVIAQGRRSAHELLGEADER